MMPNDPTWKLGVLAAPGEPRACLECDGAIEPKDAGVDRSEGADVEIAHCSLGMVSSNVECCGPIVRTSAST